MALKFTQKPQTNLSQVSMLEQQYKSGRFYLLIIALVTVLNAAILFMGMDTYFLFSPATPFYLTFFGMLFGNRMPDAFYDGVTYNAPWADALLIAGIVLTVAVVIAYIALFVLSKKSLNAYIVGTVIFGIDTLILLGGAMWFGDIGLFIKDIIFHALIVGLLIHNCIRGHKLNEAKAKEEAAAAEAARIAAETPEIAAIEAEKNEQA